MRFRLAAVLCASLLLTGCSLPSLGNLLTFSSNGDSTSFPDAPRAVAAAAPTAATPGAPDPFCVSVAQQDAQRGEFDPATQQRMMQRGYQQCVAMYRSP